MSSKCCGWYRWAIGLVLGLCSVLAVQAASQCTATFAYPVQSNVEPGKLSMSQQASIKYPSSTTNPDTNYPFLDSNIYDQANCYGSFSNCKISKQLGPALSGLQFTTDPADFPVLPTGATAICPQATSNADLPSNSYTTLTLNNYTACSYTLTAGSTYKLQSLSITSGGRINLNGATLYVNQLTVSNDNTSSGILGSGTIYVKNLIVSGDGYIQSANIKAYGSITMSLNNDTVGATFSPHYLNALSLSKGAKARFSGGTWSIASLTMLDQTSLVFASDATLYLKNAFSLSSQASISPVNTSINQLQIYGFSSMAILDQSSMNAFVYLVNGDMALSKQGALTGAVSARNVTMGDQSSITYNKFTGSLPNCSTASIDHFELVLPSSAVTCLPASLTLRACQNASCSSLYTGSTSVTLSPSSLTNGAWVTGNPVALTSGTATLSLRQSSAATVTVGVSTSTPAATNATLCQVGTGTLSAANCALTFADSGFVLTVPNQTANKPVSGTIQANASCVAAFANVSRTINFWSGYSNPTAVSIVGSAPAVTVNGTSIGKSSTSATGITLAFDATGTAPLSSVNYADAGAMTLNASYSGSSTTSDAGQNMTGNTTFVSAPAGICIAPATTCSAGDATCPAYKRAGETFSVTLKPVAWESDNDTDLCSGNAVTPNFTLAGIALGSTVVAPSGGAAATLAVTSYDHVASASATQSVTESLSEVGVFRLTATPPTYLGMTIPASQSAPVGRITPWDYLLSGGAITPACNADFSYMDQPFAVSYTLTARNSSGATTTNYSGSFVKSSTALVAENANDGVDRSTRLSSTSGSWSHGMLTVSALPVTFKQLTGTTPDGPFSQLAIGVGITDKDGLGAVLSNANMNPGSSGTCTTCTAGLLGTQRLLAGRLNAGSASAIPTSALTVPLAFEYWNGSAWTLNSADLCSALTLSSSGAFLFDRPWSASSQALTLAGTATSTLGLSSTRTGSGSSSATAQGGYLWLHFSAPGVNDRAHYRIGLAAQSPAATWLSYDWNGDGSAVQDESGGWVFFNQWRGSDRVIYRREAW